ncbi:AAA family ATPase [Quadrisphaera sp. INWT6]|nr:AAA family ATPase [Quadrisphaera sp. INWT6]
MADVIGPQCLALRQQCVDHGGKVRLAELSVSNYRALRDVTVPLSRFACFVGRNNSGKSSLLQAVLLLRSGSSLGPSNYHDPLKPIRIALTFEGIGEQDLLRVKEEQHRERFRAMLVNGSITLVRLYDTSGKSTLLFRKLIPRDENLNESILIDAMKANPDRSRQAVVDLVPAMDALLSPKVTQKEVRTQLEVLCARLAEDEMRPEDAPLSTGLDKSIFPLLPEVVYIPAVKDVADEIKTTGSAAFGKLLAILFDEIQGEFDAIDEQFKDLQRRLSRVLVDGQEVDERLPEVQRVEQTLEKYVRQNFPDVSLRLSVSAPDLKQVLHGAELTADDGTSGPIAAKGDGLKRAVAFAVLQAWAELKATGLGPREASSEPGHSSPRQPYILLFEEPELFLHPAAQQQLFKALSSFATEHEVLVTTHSPAFVDASETTHFVKVAKVLVDEQKPPATTCHPVDLSDLGKKDQLQLIGYENNNAALFADVVVLVEGDSDFIVLPEIARSMHSDWDSHRHSVVFVRVSGKGSFARYRNFFGEFGVDVHIACDLDALTEGFDKLGPDDDSLRARDALMAHLQRLSQTSADDATSSSLKSLRGRGDVQGLWRTAVECHEAWRVDPKQFERLNAAVEAFFQRAMASEQYRLLLQSDDAELHRLKGLYSRVFVGSTFMSCLVVV